MEVKPQHTSKVPICIALYNDRATHL